MKTLILLLAMAWMTGGCTRRGTDGVGPTPSADRVSGTSAGQQGSSTATAGDLAREVNLNGFGPWYRFLQSGDANTLARLLLSRISQDQTILLTPGMPQVEQIAPEGRKLITAPSMGKDTAGRLLLTFWYGTAPGFAPTRFTAAAGDEGRGTVALIPLQTFLP